jgi:hypothetical protein
MKNLSIILLCLPLLFGGCDSSIPEPVNTGVFEIIVIDNNDEIVRDASVTVFANEDDLASGKNPIAETQKTADFGKAFLPNLTSSYSECYINVEKLAMNNWTGKKYIDLRGKPSRIVIQIKQSLAARITGKTGKRWQQLYQSVNGQKFEDCANKRIHWFKTDFVKYMYNSPSCGPDQLVGQEAWAENPANRSQGLLLGNPNDPKLLRSVQILELTDSKLLYYYTKDDKSGRVTVVEEFKAL